MKITTPAGIIECTVDEYEDMVVRGLLPGKEQLIEQNKEDDWIDMLRRLTPEKPKDAKPGQNWPPTVALYGCEMTQPITAYGCPSIDQIRFTTNTTDNDIIDNKTQLT